MLNTSDIIKKGITMSTYYKSSPIECILIIVGENMSLANHCYHGNMLLYVLQFSA